MVARDPLIDRIGYVVVLVIAKVPPIDRIGYVMVLVIANARITANVARGRRSPALAWPPFQMAGVWLSRCRIAAGSPNGDTRSASEIDCPRPLWPTIRNP